MRPRTHLAAVAIAAGLTFALTGCFAGSPSAPIAGETAPPAISVDPATGDLLEGTGYTVNAPEGWAVPPDAPPVADIYAVADEPDPDNSALVDTVNVLLGPASDESLAEFETGAARYLEEAKNAKDVEVRPRVQIAGTECVHIAAHYTDPGTSRWTEQYTLVDSGTAYTITFTFRESVERADREAVAESVLATWTWVASTAPEGYFEDPAAQFAITFPGKPTVNATESGGTRASYSNAADAVLFAARGTAATETEVVPETLEGLFLQVVDQGAVVTGPGEKFELAGLPALMNSFTDPDGKPATMVVAGEGHRLYQLIVIGGTPEQSQAFFDSFTLLD